MSRTSMWRWPIVLGALTLVALVAALMTDGPMDLLWSLVLGVPVLASLWYGLRRRRSD